MDFALLGRSQLFADCTEADIRAMLTCLRAQEKRYAKDEIICHAGDEARWMGLVLSGRAVIERTDVLGTRSILGAVEPGEVYAETYACLPGSRLMVSVTAAAPTRVLVMDLRPLLAEDGAPCPHKMKLLRNLLTVAAQKNLALSRRSMHTAPKTIRGRLMAYLSWMRLEQGADVFTLPFNRQQLADYLDVDRSALSAEMSRLQREGILHFRKSRIELLLLESDCPQ